MAEQPRCEACVYFTKVDNNTGLCRYNPPVVMPMPIHAPTTTRPGERLAKPFTTWPVVRLADWCGRHITKKV